MSSEAQSSTSASLESGDRQGEQLGGNVVAELAAGHSFRVIASSSPTSGASAPITRA